MSLNKRTHIRKCKYQHAGKLHTKLHCRLQLAACFLCRCAMRVLHHQSPIKAPRAGYRTTTSRIRGTNDPHVFRLCVCVCVCVNMAATSSNGFCHYRHQIPCHRRCEQHRAISNRIAGIVTDLEVKGEFSKKALPLHPHTACSLCSVLTYTAYLCKACVWTGAE